MCKKILLDYNYNYNNTIFTKWQHMHTKGLKIKNPPRPSPRGCFCLNHIHQMVVTTAFPITVEHSIPLQRYNGCASYAGTRH